MNSLSQDIREATLFRPILLAVVIVLSAVISNASPTFAELDSPDTPSGYLARLLINEVPFPGERGYESETTTKEAMVQILWVLHSRIYLIPTGYTQEQIAGVKSQNIIDVITGAGGKRQCEGFYRNEDGKFVTDRRVEERIEYLLKIANKGSNPGRFSNLINFGQNLARTYLNDGIEGADIYANLEYAGSIMVTGHAYSWMTDINNYHPGGNFVSIPLEYNGSLSGNRFFTLRKAPK
jgi:hypothetical protein